MRASLTDGRSRWAAVALASLAAVGLLALTHARSAGATVQALAGTQISWTIALLALAVAGPILTSVLLCSGQATVGARYGRARRRIAAWAIAVDTLRLGWLWVALHAVGAYASVDVTVEAYGVVAPLGPPLRSPCPDRASSS